MIEVRRARESDIGWICCVEEQVFSLPWTYDQLSNFISGVQNIMLVAEVDGSPAGYMGMETVLDEGYVTNVCTAPEFRRRGVAASLIDAMKDIASELGLSFMTLEVRVSNTAARSLYAKKGFSDVGIRPGYYEKPREDAVIMTLYSKKVLP